MSNPVNVQSKNTKIKCNNCGNSFSGKYCSECGQSSDNTRLDFHFLWHDLQHGILHFDNGIFYSFKELFSRPGHSIRDYIDGKRVKHFKPFSMVIVLAALYGVLYHNFDMDNASLFVKTPDQSIDYKAYNEWISTHFSWMTLGSIPLYTLGTFICFRKQGYNFVEYLIMNTFKASQRLFAHIAVLPLHLVFSGTSETKNLIAIVYVFDIVLGFITNIQFFNRLPIWKTILLSILSHLIFLFVLIIVAFFGVLIYQA